MKHRVLGLTTVLVLAALLVPASASAQIAPCDTCENHYKVYEVPQDIPMTLPPPGILLSDQFGQSIINMMMLDKFANPVMKNNEPIADSLAHQTWWQIDTPEPGRRVDLNNQFGRQTWFIKNGRYLVAPAAKNSVLGLPATFLHNHYKCYDAQGPAVDIPVTLVDQWGEMAGAATIPMFWCNPVEKALPDGRVFPPVDPLMHLACYQIEPPMTMQIPFVAFDQFGQWDLEAIQPCWLCVPSEKIFWVGTEQKTWGGVKELYKTP